MQPTVHFDEGVIVKTHPNQHYKTLFNRKTGFFARLEDEGYDEPFWCEKGPELIDLSITNYCERQCSFCYRYTTREPGHISMSLFEKLLKQASDTGVMQIALGGGNPNQNPHFKEIIREIRSTGIVPSYTSNGDGLTDDILKATAEHCGAMAVSVYEFKEDVLAETIDRITSFGIRLNLHLLLVRNHLKYIRKWLQDPPGFMEKVNAVIFLNYKPINSGEDIRIDTEDEWKNFFRMIEESNRVNIGFDSCCVPGLLKYTKAVSKTLIEPCEAARFSAFISEEGKMYPCSFMVNTERYGNLKENSLQDIWRYNRFFVDFRNAISYNQCRGCKLQGVCQGGCQFKPEINNCDNGIRG